MMPAAPIITAEEPEIAETMLAKYFEGPKMFIAAAEESQNDLVQGRGDAYCGMVNASYNLKLRNMAPTFRNTRSVTRKTVRT